MFALRSTIPVLILSVATLFGWSRGDLPSLVDFASVNESIPVPDIPALRACSQKDHQGHRQYDCDLSPAESELLDDADDPATSVPTVRGARSCSAAGCHGMARLIVSRVCTESETVEIRPLFGSLCRLRC